ncbi:MAG: 2-oxoglutarate ferredoxin oxidoreductase subunit alpha [Deltaproteobacteria bacterium]|jgi:2-oxoglutarate ferredoxin oxidoreductase subunit alpha|nr:2-oxoglutarate ferredoxin oxidoreductase subunit alpha [Deltaproteobacteria bacterium]
MKKWFNTGNAAITEGAILAGCGLFAGYPITPATEIAENMSRRLPQVGKYYIQAEDELSALHICIGGALGGLKAMTATSGPGYVLFADPYGWAIGSEVPVVIVNSQRVGPVSGITGAPGQGEFYLSRYPTHGGNFETIVLAPNCAQEAFDMTVEAFYLAERFRTPVTILADQLVTDGWESFSTPENEEELRALGLRVEPRRINPGPCFFPPTDEIDIPPVVLGHGTGGACSDWTPTEEGYDTEEVEAQMGHAHRLIYKILNHRELIDRHESYALDDDPEIVLVSYGSPSRIVRSAVKKARELGVSAGCIRLKSLWPFQDSLFRRKAVYLAVELNADGQLVREVERAARSPVHFIGRCGEPPAVAELVEVIVRLGQGKAPEAIPGARVAW